MFASGASDVAKPCRYSMLRLKSTSSFGVLKPIFISDDDHRPHLTR